MFVSRHKSPLGIKGCFSNLQKIENIGKSLMKNPTLYRALWHLQTLLTSAGKTWFLFSIFVITLNFSSL